MKPLLLLLVFLFLTEISFAQKADTIAYFVKNSGKVVSVKDSADYIMFVIPPDTSVDKNLYLIKGYYPSSGKIMFVTGSKSPSEIIYQGSYISFYPNGRRHTIELFDDGKNTG